MLALALPRKGFAPWARRWRRQPLAPRLAADRGQEPGGPDGVSVPAGQRRGSASACGRSACSPSAATPASRLGPRHPVLRRRRRPGRRPVPGRPSASRCCGASPQVPRSSACPCSSLALVAKLLSSLVRYAQLYVLYDGAADSASYDEGGRAHRRRPPGRPDLGGPWALPRHGLHRGPHRLRVRPHRLHASSAPSSSTPGSASGDCCSSSARWPRPCRTPTCAATRCWSCSSRRCSSGPRASARRRG